MVEKQESDDEQSETKDHSTSKNNPKPDTAEILRRQGPEFEPPKEDIAEKQRFAGQGTGQTTVGPSTDPASKTSDEEAQQKKEAELAQKIEKLEQEEKDLKSQKDSEFREKLQQIKEQEAQQSNSETEQNEDYYQGLGQ